MRHLMSPLDLSKEELEELIPIAEKQWIESEGELPDDYVSPLK